MAREAGGVRRVARGSRFLAESSQSGRSELRS
jgi:hypothetical protein